MDVLRQFEGCERANAFARVLEESAAEKNSSGWPTRRKAEGSLRWMAMCANRCHRAEDIFACRWSPQSLVDLK